MHKYTYRVNPEPKLSLNKISQKQPFQIKTSARGQTHRASCVQRKTAMQMLPLTAATSFEHRGPQCLMILTRVNPS